MASLLTLTAIVPLRHRVLYHFSLSSLSSFASLKIHMMYLFHEKIVNIGC